MKTTIKYLIAVTLLAVGMIASTAHAEIVFSDDFSTSGTGGGHRLFFSNADHANWQGSYDASWGAASLWTSASGALTNAVTETTTTDSLQRANEKPITYLTSVSTTNTSLDQITFSFDYTVGTGSTLHFHAMGLKLLGAAPAGSTQLWSTHAHSGNISHGVGLDANFTDINLFDGSHWSNAPQITFASDTSGTYTGTFDMSSYGITNVADLDYIAVGFGIQSGNTDGTGAVSIDNFSIVAAVPEPTSVAMFGLAMAGLGFRRRK